MSGGNIDFFKTLPISTQINPWTLVVDNGSGQWVNTTAGQAPDAIFNVMTDAVMPTLTPVFVAAGELLMKGKVKSLSASGAISQYATVFSDNSGLITATNTGYRIGKAMESATASGDIIMVQLDPGYVQVMGTITQATAVTQGASAETVLTQFQIYPNTLRIGDSLDLYAVFISIAENSTDTHEYRLRVSNTANSVAGTVIADTGAIGTISANTGGRAYGSLVVGALGSGTNGKLQVAGETNFKTAVTMTDQNQVSIDTTLSIYVVCTVQHGTSNTGNQSRLDQFSLARFPDM